MALWASIIEFLWKLWGTYDDKKIEAQVAAEELHEKDMANEPRTDDAFAAKLRSYEDHTF